MDKLVHVHGKWVPKELKELEIPHGWADYVGRQHKRVAELEGLLTAAEHLIIEHHEVRDMHIGDVCPVCSRYRVRGESDAPVPDRQTGR